MTELYFKGKEFVYNHHLTVPHCPLEMHPKKGIGTPRLDGNLIIHGDNLHALKALLPQYAGKIDCISIDPPYNTGNEGWCYNDNVNSPMIKEWLDGNPIGIDDSLRHDKWCAMMWPRLRLLQELLKDDGVIFVCIDDIEQHRLRGMMNEIFGTDNFVASFIWQHRKSSQNDINISLSHNYILLYAKCKEEAEIRRERIDSLDASKFSNPDDDERGPWKLDPMDAPNIRENLTYPIINPKTKQEYWPPQGRCWRFSQDEFEKAKRDNRIVFGRSGNSRPQYKRFLSEAKAKGKSTSTIWNSVETATDAKKHINKIFSKKNLFDTPKPVSLLRKAIDLILNKDGVILDSFAGSGTTAHAVLEANKIDGGNRRFILVEMEDYADRLTAERVRRVIKGYDFTGTQRTELMREKLSWTKLKNAGKLVHAIEGIENLHGHEYDRIKKEIKDRELIVTGERRIADKADGLGGEFTFCTLGTAIEMDKILTGEALPSYDNIAAVLFHTATSLPSDPSVIDEKRSFIGEAPGLLLWLIYKPDLEWLKTPQAALTLTFARELAKKHPQDRHLVFAPANYTNPKMLAKERIRVEFAPLPYALYRVEKV